MAPDAKLRARARRTTADDRELLDRLKAGDEQAFAELVARLNKPMTGVAFALVGNAATADEVVQETWLSVISNLAGFRGDASLKNWIFSILTNTARTRARRDGRMITTVFDEETAKDEPAVSPSRFDQAGNWQLPPTQWDELTPERVVSGRQIWQHVREAIDALPPAQRAVLLILEDAEVDQTDAARLLGLSLNNLRVLLHRARSRIRAAIDAL